jgi:hypothetical protein
VQDVVGLHLGQNWRSTSHPRHARGAADQPAGQRDVGDNISWEQYRHDPGSLRVGFPLGRSGGDSPSHTSSPVAMNRLRAKIFANVG